MTIRGVSWGLREIIGSFNGSQGRFRGLMKIQRIPELPGTFLGVSREFRIFQDRYIVMPLLHLHIQFAFVRFFEG